MMLLSGDLPRSRLLDRRAGGDLGRLALAPFLFRGAQPLNAAAKICVFIVLVASYDLLLGYTGIVSFAHTMFYGLGGYGVGLALYALGRDAGRAALGLAVALCRRLLAFLIGLFSLRVRAIFYAMITLAVASAFAILASQLSGITGGEDGRSFRVPELLRPATPSTCRRVRRRSRGARSTYYLVFVGALLLFLLLLRIVNSPFGRVLQAIRENEFRAEALGYRTVVYRTSANCLAAGHGRAGRRAQCAVAALYRARYHALLRHHGRHPADGGDRRHGHDVRRGDRRRAVHAGAELPAEADGHGAAKATEAAAAAAEPAAPGPLAAVARRAVRAVVYFFPTGIVGKLRGGVDC